MSVKWDNLFALIETLRVDLPQPAPGEPVDFQKLRELAYEVQAKRDRATRVYQKLTQKAAIAKRDVRILRESLRIAKLQAVIDPQVRSLRSKSERDRAVEELTVSSSSALAVKEGALYEWEAALASVDMQIKGLEQSKQILNTIVRLAIADIGLTNDSSQKVMISA